MCWHGTRSSFMDRLSLTSWSLQYSHVPWTYHYLASNSQCEASTCMLCLHAKAQCHCTHFVFMTGGLCILFTISKQNLCISSNLKTGINGGLVSKEAAHIQMLKCYSVGQSSAATNTGKQSCFVALKACKWCQKLECQKCNHRSG